MQAVGRQAKDIDGKVCAKKKVWKAKGGNDATRDAAVEATNGRWSCVDYEVGAGQSTHNDVKDIASTHGFMWRFGNAGALKQREDKHATANEDDANTGQGYTNSGWPGTESGNTKTAEGMAGDLRGLDKGQRNKVAGLLSKTISGAEVVEIRAVSTTSVMLNACYDLQSEGFSIVNTAYRLAQYTVGYHSRERLVRLQLTTLIPSTYEL